MSSQIVVVMKSIGVATKIACIANQNPHRLLTGRVGCMPEIEDMRTSFRSLPLDSFTNTTRIFRPGFKLAKHVRFLRNFDLRRFQLRSRQSRSQEDAQDCKVARDHPLGVPDSPSEFANRACQQHATRCSRPCLNYSLPLFRQSASLALCGRGFSWYYTKVFALEIDVMHSLVLFAHRVKAHCHQSINDRAQGDVCGVESH